MEALGYIAIAGICLLFSNLKTWRMGVKSGVEGIMHQLKGEGVFDYLDE